MKINKERLQELIWGSSDSDFEIVLDEIYDNGRWSIYHNCVIKDKNTGKYYDAHYSEGATEYQDESPFEYNEPDKDGNLELNEVEPYEETVIKYRRVKNES